MRESLPVIILVSALMISACGVPSRVESTATPTIAELPPATGTHTPTATLPAEESATATPETPVPTNPADCTNRAAFVADVTIADNEFVPGGSDFTKTWSVKNTGTCIW